MNNRVGAAIVPASSRRGIAVSEFPPRYCGERAFASGREWGPIHGAREPNALAQPERRGELPERDCPLRVFLQSNDHGDSRCEQLISMSPLPQWRVPPFFPCRQALTGCATEIVSARCAANSACIKTAI